MSQAIIVNSASSETRVAILDNGLLVELAFERNDDDRVVGNIYRGRVENVLPGMEAAFVDIGLERNAFLYVDDAVHPKSPVEGDDESLDVPRGQHPSITSILKEGQEIFVQVVKEPIGTKGARVVTQLTIPGRYLVLMPDVDYVGVSRRISDEKERDRLRAMAARVKSAGFGVIVRTVAEGVDDEELSKDLEFLMNAWHRIQRKARKGAAPQIIYRDHDLVYRIVRDFFSDEIDSLIVDNRAVYERCLEMLKTFSPHLRSRVQLFEGEQGILSYYGVEPEIERALKRKVWLSCGGYLVIDQTEALTVIDVNTGKFIGKTSLEDTVLVTNIEAAREIARQMRLRNLAGIIIIDFIDMTRDSHRDEVIQTFTGALKADKTKVNILGFTSLGLLEVTRKKVRQGLSEYLSNDCPHCGGTGRVLSKEARAAAVEREMRATTQRTRQPAYLFAVHPAVASLLIGPGGSNLARFEEEIARTVFLRGQEDLEPGELKLLCAGPRDEVEKAALPVREGEILVLEVREPHLSNPGDGIGRVEGYVIDIEGGAHRVGERVKVRIDKAFRTYARGQMLED